MEEMNLIFFLNFSKKSIQCGIHYLMNYVKNYFHNLNIYIYTYISENDVQKLGKK